MKQELTVTKLQENLYRIQEDSEFMNVDAYLICGQDKAMVIDGLAIMPGLYNCVRAITDKPMSMIVTHGHPDHAGKGMQEFLEAGCEVYRSPREKELVELYTSATDLSLLKDIEEGDAFDLGGICLETMELPGHTPGSVLVFWRKEKILFSSDAIGSGGLWMQLPESLPLTEYMSGLEKLEDLLTIYPETKIYTGHSWQIISHIDKDRDYLNKAYVDELVALTAGIIEGTLTGEKKEIPMDIMEGIDIRSVNGNKVVDYCYDAQKIDKIKK